MSPTIRRELVVITAVEWRNLIARREIRIAKNRIVSVADFDDSKSVSKLFGIAPFTKLGSSVDVFILELKENWLSSCPKNPDAPRESAFLHLDHVQNHHTVSAHDIDYYGQIGAKYGVILTSAILERQWADWTIRQKVSDSMRAADELLSSLKLPVREGPKRPDKTKWWDLASLSLHLSRPSKSKLTHAETFVLHVREIADRAANVRDSDAFRIAAVLEWIEIRTGKNPLNRTTRASVLPALQEAKAFAFEDCSSSTSAALEMLRQSFPKAFTQEISPRFIGFAARLETDARSLKLRQISLHNALEHMGRDGQDSRLLGFLVSIWLGVEHSNQLLMASTFQDLVEVQWETENMNQPKDSLRD